MLRSRMFWTLFLGYGFLIVFAVSLLGFLLDMQVRKNELAGLEEHLINQAEIVREVARGWDVSAGGDRPLPLPKTLSTRVTVISADGTVLADSTREPKELDNHADRPEVVEAFATGVGRSMRRGDSLGVEALYVALRADNGGRPFVIRVATPVDHVLKRIADLQNLTVLAGALSAALAVAMAFLLTRRTVKPIRDLIHGAREIAAGDYGHRVFASGGGEIAQLTRTFNHMSERLAAQFTQIDDDRQQLRTVLSSMVEGVIAIDVDQKILFANDRAGQLLEFSPRVAVGRKLWELIRQRSLQDGIRSALSVDNHPVRSISMALPGSRSFVVQVARLPGHPSRGAVLVFHDDTELRRLERLRQEFVANVSHELKTPLAIIKACVETLIDGGVDDPQFRGQFLERIADQAERLHNLILDLLRLARIESATEAFTMDEHDLGVLVGQCLERRRTLAEGKKQTLRALPPPEAQGPALVWVDDEAIEQILDNLVDNALKYTPEGGVVEVQWGRRGDQIELEVRDTGIGIPEAELPRIFERFYRVDKARSRELGGTGLGLSIVKHLVQAMQGTVEARSVVGEGSAFVIRLPALLLHPAATR